VKVAAIKIRRKQKKAPKVADKITENTMYKRYLQRKYYINANGNKTYIQE
jgi:hypothetical protein